VIDGRLAGGVDDTGSLAYPAMPGDPTDHGMAWAAARPGLSPTRLVLGAAISAAAVLFAAWILRGFDVPDFTDALLLVVVIAILNAIVPPLVAALRLPLTVVLGFVIVLLIDAATLYVGANAIDSVRIDSFGWALAAALVVAAVTTVLQVLAGVDDDDSFGLRRTQRIARRAGSVEHTDVPGILYLEIDGLALPVLRRAMRDGHAPVMARWLAEDSHTLLGWETDLSSQTGASQAGILLGSNHDIPAFRWVEKQTGRVMTCSAPNDCVEIERRLATGVGLLIDGGASRGNLLSGEADATILTVSRISNEKRSNPGYRNFLASAHNVSRVLVLFFGEVILEWTAALQAIRRDVRPRGHRGGAYPFIRAGMCVVVRDLIVHGVLADMMAGRAAVYATFSSYDEVAHHSGLERSDTLEALRKLDKQFGRLDRARKYAPRPYEIVVLSDHGQTQGATFKQRNGYTLDELVRRSLATGDVKGIADGDESATMVGTALGEATGHGGNETPSSVGSSDVAVLGSGNLGLIYFLGEQHRLSFEEITDRHPRLFDALRSHPHVGWLLVRSEAEGALVLGANGSLRLRDGHVDGEDPLAAFGPGAAGHLARTDTFPSVGDIMVGSFYDPELDEGCAFEELISFHGGLGGPQTEAFVMAPRTLTLPAEPLVGAAAVHGLLFGWRAELQGPFGKPATELPAIA
jgi:uncharacterized membrane protein YvlD (DUF360 family)